MKKYKSVKAVLVAITILCLIGTMFGETILALRGKEYVSENQTVLMDSKENIAPLVAVYDEKQVFHKWLMLKLLMNYKKQM